MPLNRPGESCSLAPLLSLPRSRAVRVWTPRVGWVRQRDPGRRRAPRSPLGFCTESLNALIPLSPAGRGPVREWVRRRLRTLRADRGLLVLLVRHEPRGRLSAGLYHDTRERLYRGIYDPGFPQDPSLPAEIRAPGA